MALDAGGVGGGTSTSGGGSTTGASSGSKGSGGSKSFGSAMAQVTDTSKNSRTTNRSNDTKSTATPESRPAATPSALPTSTPQPGSGQTQATDDKKQEDDNELNTAVAVRSGARARNNLVERQNQRVINAVNSAPLKPYAGEVFRHVARENYTGYNQHQYAPPGRYNRPGQSAVYTSENMRGLEIEAKRYTNDPTKTGLEDRTVIRSQFAGKVIDATSLPGVTEGALAEPHAGGLKRNPVSKWVLGEEPYHHTRALSDAARARGAEAVRVPAGDGAVHVNLLSENVGDPASQFQYREHFHVDVNGVREPVQSTPRDMSAPPPARTPSNYFNPAEGSREALKNQADATTHRRAGGWRYGALAGGGIATYNAVRDGEFTTSDAVNVATGTALSTGAAVVDDALTKKFGGTMTGGFKAGGVVDGVVSAGTSVYSNAQAYERGEISAADATADVIVDTGVGVASGLAGAAAGAAIGSVVPVAGTAVGAVIGFGVGMLASWGTSEALERTGTADWAREGLGDALEDNKEGMLESAWGTVSGWFN